MQGKKKPFYEYRFLTGNQLKLIAAVSMVLDHVAAVVLRTYAAAAYSQISEAMRPYWNAVYHLLRGLGRTAFPLFVFLLAEGFFHTGSRSRYLLRLFVLAVVSEIPYDLAIYGAVFYPERQNTVFTLFLGLLTLQILEGLRQSPRIPGGVVFVLQAGVCVLSGGIAQAAGLDYGWRGILLAAAFFFFFSYRWAAAVAGFCIFSNLPWSLPAFLLLPFYNGERGGGKLRWFYLFYPLHLLALYACKCLWILL